MLCYLADEDLDNHILKASRRRDSQVDWVRVQDIGLSGCDDELILQLASEHQRVVVTRDSSTMPDAAYRRVESAESMPRVIVVPHRMAIVQATDKLLFLAKESTVDEWMGQVIYLPL